MSAPFWLASYPKSGNTWIRAFIAAMRTSQEGSPFHLNALDIGSALNSREWLDETTACDTAEHSHHRVDRLRAHAIRWALAHTPNGLRYHKIHDAWTRLADGTPLFSSELVAGCLYVVRNPLDIAVSFSHHLNVDIDAAIAILGFSDAAIYGDEHRRHNQVRQKLLTWSEHAESWLTAPRLNIRVIRYEDLLFRPLESFTAVAGYLRLKGDVASAIRTASFASLQKMESESGFAESPPWMPRFFRGGQAGEWQSALSKNQQRRVIRDQGTMMRVFGYLDDDDRILVTPRPPASGIPALIH